MISAPGIPGVVFGTRTDGDGRNDPEARHAFSVALGIADAWAYVDQVHGNHIATVDLPGNHGAADGLTTTTPGLPIAIGTADCVPVGLVGERVVGMLHAGWRGVAAGIVDRALVDGHGFETAVIGPHIGPCCYEVGPEVPDAIGGYEARTTEGTVSVDLNRAIVSQIDGRVDVVDVSVCTMCDDRFASHRRDATKDRQVAVAWL